MPATSSSGTSSLWRACKAAATGREATPHIRNQPRGALGIRGNYECRAEGSGSRALVQPGEVFWAVVQRPAEFQAARNAMSDGGDDDG